MQLLERCNDLIEESIEIREQWLRDKPHQQAPSKYQFNAALIRDAARLTKRRDIERKQENYV